MRSDITPGGVFPDYALPDHTGTVRTLSELQGRDPLILTLARGHYCPKEHQQHLELAAFQSKVAVAYTQIVTISTDDHHTLQEFRASVGAQWTFLSDPRADDPEGPRHPGVHRPRPRSDDPAHARAQAGSGHSQHLQRLLVLGPPVGLRPLA
jgi:peroxiredoxin